MNQPNILIVMTDHQRADTVLPEHPAVRSSTAMTSNASISDSTLSASAA